jgi:glycolate oxidase iron-sulfur subunit
MPYIDRCLGCVGCVPACPSGVAYGELLAGFRAYAEPRRSDRPASQRAQRRLIRETLPYAGRFRAAATAGRLGKRLAGALPGDLGAMVSLLPEELPKAAPLPYFFPAQGARRARVALLVGCVQQALAPEINWATLRVLSRNGVEVIVPQGQGCCGALSMHIGEAGQAKELALANLAVFPLDVDAVITNAAGCGSGMKEYPALFKGLPEVEQATTFAEKVLDISVFLSRLGLVEPPALEQPLTAAYHDACHLANAQGVRSEPRALLSAIPNLTLLEIPEGELCCGSAGTYNLEQPEIAGQLGERKARNILATGAEAIVTGNIGCLTQIAAHLQRLSQPLPMWHTVQVLDRAYGRSTA